MRRPRRQDILEHVEQLLVTDGDIGGALAELGPQIGKAPLSRLHALIQPLAARMGPGADIEIVASLLATIAANNKPLTIIESSNVSTLVQACLPHCNTVHHRVGVLRALESIATNYPVKFVCADLRLALVQLARTGSPQERPPALSCIGKLCAKAQTGPVDNEMKLVLAVLVDIKDFEDPNVESGLGCLLSLLRVAKQSASAFATSVLMVLRRFMVAGLDASQMPPSIKAVSESDLSDSECVPHRRFIHVRLLSLQCLHAIAQTMPSLFSPQWAIMVPSVPSSIHLRRPFGGPTVVTALLYDPSSRVRSVAAQALAAMIEHSPVPVILSTVTSGHPSGAFKPSSDRARDVLQCIHITIRDFLRRTREDPALAYVLPALSALASATPYQQLPSFAVYLTDAVSQLSSLLASRSRFHVAMRHDLYSCTAAVLSVPCQHAHGVIGNLTDLLIEDQEAQCRAPPNAFTVLGHIAKHHRAAGFDARWLRVHSLLAKSLSHGVDHVRISALTFLGSWLDTCPQLSSFHGSAELLARDLIGCWNVPSTRLRSCCLTTLSHIPLEVWRHGLSHEQRQSILSFLEGSVASHEQLDASCCLALGVISAYEPTSPLLDSAIRAIAYTCTASGTSMSTRARACNALANILDQAEPCNELIKVVETYQVNIAAVVWSGLDTHRTAPLTICASRILAQIVCHQDLGRSLAPSSVWIPLVRQLVSLASADTRHVKVKWNLCRCLGRCLRVHNELGDDDVKSVVDLLVHVIRVCPNDKVRSSAITAVFGDHDALHRVPSFWEHFDSMVRDSRSTWSPSVRDLLEARAASLPELRSILDRLYDHLDDSR